MTRMRPATVAQLRVAVADPVRVAEYRDLVVEFDPDDCYPWRGAISGKGHGRFSIGDSYVDLADHTRKRVTYTVIAHRFGYAARNGVDALLRVPLLGHWCDNPPCQNPRHWRESDPSTNRREYFARRASVLGPLADVRGARGRAQAVRDAARDGENLVAAALAGAQEVHLAQGGLFGEPTRVYGEARRDPQIEAQPADGVSADGEGDDTQSALFELP